MATYERPRFRVLARSRQVPALTVVPFARSTFSDDIIRVIDEFRDMAKAGDIDGIAIATSRRSGSITTGFWGARGHVILAAVTTLQHRIITEG